MISTILIYSQYLFIAQLIFDKQLSDIKLYKNDIDAEIKKRHIYIHSCKTKIVEVYIFIIII